MGWPPLQLSQTVCEVDRTMISADNDAIKVRISLFGTLSWPIQ
jgi:hypothetical protein